MWKRRDEEVVLQQVLGDERAPGQDLRPVCAEGLGGERSTGKNVGQWLSAGEEAGELGSRPLSSQSGTTLLSQVLTKQLHSRTCAFFFGFLEVGRGWYPNLYCFVLIAKVIRTLVNSLNTEIIQVRK